MVQKVDESHVSVKVKGLLLTLSYMPVSVRGKEREVEAEWEVLGIQVNWAKRGEMVIVAADFNGHSGGGEERSGKFGIRVLNEVGKRMLEWCEMNGLAYVNSYYQHQGRGTFVDPSKMERA